MKKSNYTTRLETLGVFYPSCIGTAYDDCHEKAVWLRCTQFAGDHPFCEMHAKLEKDFGENSSYCSWIRCE